LQREQIKHTTCCAVIIEMATIPNGTPCVVPWRSVPHPPLLGRR